MAWTGVAVLGASRVAGIILPFSFRGRRHAELEKVFRETPPGPRLSAFVAPGSPGGRGGMTAGLALAF
jgi:hypothetical protein